MPGPIFSIVIPTYDRAKTIGRAINSCLMQTFQDFEVLIIDDEKSSDNIARVVSQYRDRLEIKLILNHKGTAAAARNTGVRVAHGQYIAFLDADDMWLPRKLEICYRRLQSEPEALLYSQNYVDRGVGKYWIKPSSGLKPAEDIYEYLFLRKGWVHPTSVVLCASTARKFPFQEDLSFGDDMQLAVDLWRAGISIRMMEEPLTVYHDLYEIGRLSQSPAFNRADTREHISFIEWVETHREYMSQPAWLGYRAFFYSRFIALSAPFEALKEIWSACFVGHIGVKKSLAQTIQTFAPGIYRRMSDQIAKVFGMELPSQLAQLNKTPDSMHDA